MRFRLILRRHNPALPCPVPSAAQEKSIVVASTTSTQDSGLFGHILPLFKAKTGIEVRVVAQGTGQALDTARRGDADVVFVHAKAQEEKFVAEGFGVKRFDVMYNDFVLIGPQDRPGQGQGGKDVLAALKAISRQAPFRLARRQIRHARGGTRTVEGGGPRSGAAKPAWYREIGQGMGAALNTAVAMGAYVLSDRGTWSRFKNRGDLEIAVEGDQRLFNQYGVILVNPDKHPKREAGPRVRPSSTGWSRPKGRTRSAPTRSRASSGSSPMPIRPS